jgi:hypothetical protein
VSGIVGILVNVAVDSVVKAAFSSKVAFARSLPIRYLATTTHQQQGHGNHRRRLLHVISSGPGSSSKRPCRWPKSAKITGGQGR